MRANNRQIDLNYDRQKKYQRQQERLKAMSTTDRVKSISADLMIENLLNEASHISPQGEKKNILHTELPPWLQCESSMVPDEYLYLWSLVQNTMNLADTQKVSQLLLTSGLHIDILGYIWNLANKTVPGQLTKQEFYIVLALVKLAQTGTAFNNLSILKLIPAPTVPILQVNIFKNQIVQPAAFSTTETSQLNCDQNSHNLTSLQPISISGIKETTPTSHLSTASSVANNLSNTTCDYNVLGKKKDSIKIEKSESNYGSEEGGQLSTSNAFHSDSYKSNFPCIGTSPTTELEDDFSEFQSVTAEKPNFSEPNDEFTDFQSANTETLENLDPFKTVVISQKREIPKIPLPKSFAGKLTNLKSNILKISPESERKLKVLSPNESLSSLPESKISSTNKVSTSISVLGSNHGVGSRLANHSFNIKLDRPKFHKHLKSKTNSASLIPSSDEEIIFGVKTKNLESAIPKCFPKKSTFTLKETKIKETSIPEFKADPVSSEFTSAEMCSGENTRKIEIPMLGTLNETVLPTQTKSQDSSIDLISVEEDKYSALREIKLEVDLSATKPASNSEEINDEFGDFLSADIPSLGSELSSFQNNSKVPTDLLLDDEGENWREWTFKTEPENENSGSACSKDPIIDSTSEKDFEPFNLLYLDDQKNKISNYSAPQEQQDILNISIPPIDFESFKEKDNDFGSGKMNLELHQPASPQVTNTQPDYELLNLFGNPVQSAFNNFNKHDSLPSLDFQISPNEESEQETIWRKCLEMCQNLIQEGVDIFNKVDKKSVLDEIFATPKTNEYLNCLKIAYEIAKRINQNYTNPLPAQEDLDRLWERLEKLCCEYNIQIKPDADSATQGKINCKICFGYLGTDLVNQGSHSYHPSCANLWVNCVERALPHSS